MEFWGIEVKPGQTVKCHPGEERYIHLSQASLGETKKGNVPVPLYVHFEGKKLVIGTLSSEKFPQFSYDLVFEKEFELSHGCKDGSVFFTGYTTIISADGDLEVNSGTESESEEDLIPILPDGQANGKPAPKKEEAAAPGKAKSGPSKVKAGTEKPEMPDVDDEDEDSEDYSVQDSDEDESGDGDSSEEDMGEGDDESDEEESSEEEEKVMPKKKPESGKKRPFVPDVKTPTQEKKVKVVTSSGKGDKDGKKGGHTATPYPTKQAAKTQASDSKVKAQKSGGSVPCKSCSKTFGSENALQSHSKAKHGN